MGEEATKTEETTATETKTEETKTTSDRAVDLKDENIRDNIDEDNTAIEYEPLFDGEEISDAVLRGEEDETAGEKTAGPGPTGDDKTTEKKTESEKTTDDKSSETKTTDENGKEKTVDEKPDKKDEQISGLNTALHQERKANKQLRAQLADLEAKASENKGESDEEAGEFKDFKILTNKEYEDLLDEDPDEASKYLYKFNRYQEHQRKIEKGQLDKHKAQLAINELVNDGIEALEELVPGITTGKAQEVTEALTDFALKNGFDNEMLSALTDPRTKLVTPDGDYMILSDGAAHIVKAIKSAFDASSINEEQIRKNVEAELTPIIEARVQKALIEKLQKDPESGFRSLDMTAGSGLKDTQMHTGAISEKDYAGMSESEQMALLGG